MGSAVAVAGRSLTSRKSGRARLHVFRYPDAGLDRACKQGRSLELCNFCCNSARESIDL